MSDAPWLTIIGLGEDGPDGLAPASLKALKAAETVIGPARHLELLPDLHAKIVEWPVPFADGLALLDGLRGTQTVALASGDPFWFGAGTVIARHLTPGEWCALPNASIFSLVAAQLGWPLETTLCTGLHAAPFARVRPHLAAEQRVIVTLRDGAAVASIADWLTSVGFGPSTLHVFEAFGGPSARVRSVVADSFDLQDVAHPVTIAIETRGKGVPIPVASGKPDELFENDGQITKRPIRALTLSALAPSPGELLWDLGAGSGSIGIEWLMSHPSTHAIAIEENANRATQTRTNADSLGQDRLKVVLGAIEEQIAGLPAPDAVFIGGGLSTDLIGALWDVCPKGTRIVANAVTLESEAILLDAQARLGGELMRIELSHSAPIGSYRGWKASYPIVQWSVVI